MTRDDGEVETVSFEHSGRNRDLNDVMENQSAGALAAGARFRPGFPTATALMARQSDGHLDGHRHAATGFRDR